MVRNSKYGGICGVCISALFLSLVAFPTVTAEADLIIRLKNGKTVVLPYDRRDVEAVEFDDGKKVPTKRERHRKRIATTDGGEPGTKFVSDVREIRKAINKAVPGDDIVIKPGSFRTRGFSFERSGTKDKPIRFRAETPGTVQILADDPELIRVRGSNWIFEGLDLRGDCSPAGRCQHAFHIVGDAENTIIRKNRIRDFNAAIKSNGRMERRTNANGKSEEYLAYPDNVVISGNYIYNTHPRVTRSPVTLIDVVGGKGWVIRQNLIADFQKVRGNGVSYAAFLKGNSSDGVIERNLVMCEWKHKGGVRLGLSLGGGGTDGRSCGGGKCTIEHTNGILRNNIILNCPQDVGIYLNKAKDSRIYNNTLINTKGIDVRFDASSAKIVNNIIFGAIDDRNGGTHTASNNLLPGLFSDGPEAYFKDWPRADFAVRKQEGIVDKGAHLDDVKDDFCGNPRDSAKPDIGAIEYGAGKCDVGAILRRAEAFGKN